MKVNLITKTDAITVLNIMLSEENWEHMIDTHFDVYRAEGMELHVQEDVIEFVVDHYTGPMDPDNAWVFCEGLIWGIRAEARRQCPSEIDQILEELSSTREVDQTKTAGHPNSKEYTA
jgi:hypothetical protein